MTRMKNSAGYKLIKPDEGFTSLVVDGFPASRGDLVLMKIRMLHAPSIPWPEIMGVVIDYDFDKELLGSFGTVKILDDVGAIRVFNFDVDYELGIDWQFKILRKREESE